jgi:peroxiredoxin Q/BCP
MVRTVMDVKELILATVFLGGALIATAPHPATALEIGTAVPDFTLPSTTGGKISLSQFRGKLVLIEFYGAAFAPT